MYQCFKLYYYRCLLIMYSFIIYFIKDYYTVIVSFFSSPCYLIFSAVESKYFKLEVINLTLMILFIFSQGVASCLQLCWTDVLNWIKLQCVLLLLQKIDILIQFFLNHRKKFWMRLEPKAALLGFMCSIFPFQVKLLIFCRPR